MSVYYLDKLMYQLNRDPMVQARYKEDREALLEEYRLTDEERQAVLDEDIGKLYSLGNQPQLLMHFAALVGYAWMDYIEAMRVGAEKYGEPQYQR